MITIRVPPGVDVLHPTSAKGQILEAELKELSFGAQVELGLMQLLGSVSKRLAR